MTAGGDNIVRMKGAENVTKKAFLGWQCRLRQLSMRDDEGRPSLGMRPTLEVDGQDVGRITVVTIKRDSEESTAEFRHIVKRTHDPKERFEAALRFLQSHYFQDPTSFDDQLTAVFSMTAALPQQIAGREDCILTFEQFSQTYRLACKASLLEEHDSRFQAAYWHNALFNPAMPTGVRIVSFSPDWSKTEANPPVS